MEPATGALGIEPAGKLRKFQGGGGEALELRSQTLPIALYCLPDAQPLRCPGQPLSRILQLLTHHLHLSCTHSLGVKLFWVVLSSACVHLANWATCLDLLCIAFWLTGYSGAGVSFERNSWSAYEYCMTVMSARCVEFYHLLNLNSGWPSILRMNIPALAG